MKAFSLFAAAALFGASVWAEDAGFIRKSFNVAPGGKLTIRADRGSIDVKTAATDKVEIEVTREVGKGSNEAILERHHLTFSQDGNDVTVKAEMDHDGKLHLLQNLRYKVHYDVTMPEIRANLYKKARSKGSGKISSGYYQISISGCECCLRKWPS